MIKYQVRSKELIDIVNDLNSKRLIKSPYFQRNLVWRELHKIDFIKTILMGLPFPQIFIAKGEIDVETMTTYSCVVDGQQRLTAIQDYVRGALTVDDQIFGDLDKNEKENFLKYQIPIIDLDIKHDEPLLKEVFHRLNRTFYALSTIEKQSTEFATSEMMIVAKVLCDQFFIYEEDKDGELTMRDIDPLISKDIVKKAKSLVVEKFQNLILNGEVFSSHEISRKVPLSFVLHLLATCTIGWYNRNSGVRQLLDNDEFSFEHYSELSDRLEKIADFLLRAKLKSGSYWYNKANFFSLVILLNERFDELPTLKPTKFRTTLEKLEKELSPEYLLAAKEAVNNKRERIIRHEALDDALFL